MTEATKKVVGSRLAFIFARRISQLVFLILFIVLFIKTDYNGSDTLDTAVNLLFRLDPFLAACVLLGVKTVVIMMWPSLIILLLTLCFGRWFCGWFCPMGTLLDGMQRILPARGGRLQTYFPQLPLYLLVFSLVSSLCGFGVAGFFDPFSILVRGLAQAVYPLFNSLTVSFFTFTYSDLPEFVNGFTEPLYALMKSSIMPAGQKFFHLAYLSLFMLLLVLFMEGLQRRFFCRNVCPVGALLGLVGRFGLLAGRGGNTDCRACRICAKNCRMGAIDDSRDIDMAGCNLCFECVSRCPRQIITFGPQVSREGRGTLSLSRRKFIGSLFLGVCLSSVKTIEARVGRPNHLLIRPPGTLGEKEFLSRCVRCAECIQVCVGNALQPALLQAGIDGMFSPMLVARTGYCEFNCTLCGQVCPTGAIEKLALKEKHDFKIGHAWFDKNLCLPYDKAIPCMVCEEHCPTPEKAIRFRKVTMAGSDGQSVTVKQPYVVDSLCIGCGICETKCPLPGKPAIYVTSAGEVRNPENRLPPPQSNTLYG
ncbi:MAG: 4Fe-4S binding protein [Desulforhopalus sp.]